ncbi:MAG: carboxypeptidase regulatory-like domain-containing protein [Vicinamibacterales bacterium]
MRSLGPALVVALTLAVGTTLPSMANAQPGGQTAAGQRTPPRMLPLGQTPPRGTAVLRGVVVAADSGGPIRRAQVRASAPGADSRTILTDEQGRFELKELAAGRYTLTASKGGFVSLQYGQRRPGEPGTPVELVDGQAMEKIVIGLPRGSVITGRIVDEFGEALTGAQVRALRYGYAGGVRRLLPAGQADRTDDQGTFRIFGLPPGEYIVSATLNEDRGGPRRGANADDQPSTGYAPTYYPGTTTAADAERVTLGLAQEVGGIGFGLSLMRLSRVSGRVVGATDLRGMVVAMPDDGVRMGGLRGGPLSADGTFEISGLAPGRYVLVAGPRGRRSGTEPSGRLPITVSGVDLENVTIALAPPAVATGVIVTDTGKVGLRAGQIRVSFTPAQPDALEGFRGGGVSADDDFTFELGGITEPGYLRVTPPRGWYLKAIERGGQDITDQLLSIEPGGRLTGVRVVLTESASSVSGTVRDDRGNAVLDATVVVFPDDESKWAFQSRHIATARPDTTGRFEIVGLPGYAEYRIVAVQGLENGFTGDPGVLAGLRDRAERLSLTQGEVKTLDVRLRP